MSNRDLKEAEEVLGKPFLPDFSEYTRKIRNYVMIIGSTSIVMVANNLTLSNEASLFGLKFEHMNIHIIYQIFLATEIYFLVHFVWLAIDNFLAWRLRFSGTHKIYGGGFALEGGADSLPDPSQTTLYFWWSREAHTLSNTQNEIEKITSGIAKLEEKLDKHDFDELNKHIKTLNTSFTKTAEIVSSTRIPDSLMLYNNWFKYFHNVQGWRWIIIELALPIAIGGWSIFLLCQKYCLIKIFL